MQLFLYSLVDVSRNVVSYEVTKKVKRGNDVSLKCDITANSDVIFRFVTSFNLVFQMIVM